MICEVVWRSKGRTEEDTVFSASLCILLEQGSDTCTAERRRKCKGSLGVAVAEHYIVTVDALGL